MTNVTLFSFSPTKFVCPVAALNKSPASVPALSAFCLPSSMTFTFGVYPSVSPTSTALYLVPAGSFSNTNCSPSRNWNSFSSPYVNFTSLFPIFPMIVSSFAVFAFLNVNLKVKFLVLSANSPTVCFYTTKAWFSLKSSPPFFSYVFLNDNLSGFSPVSVSTTVIDLMYVDYLYCLLHKLLNDILL